MSTPDGDREVRKRYDLSPNIPVLRTRPTERERQQRRGYFEMVRDALGVQEWMWKTFAGAVIAVLVLAPDIQDIGTFWTPKFTTAYKFAVPYVQSVGNVALDFVDELIEFNSESDGPQTILAPRAVNSLSGMEAGISNRILQFENARIWRAGSIRHVNILQSVSSRQLFSDHNPWFPKGSPVSFFALDPLHAVMEATSARPPEIQEPVKLVSASVTSGVLFLDEVATSSAVHGNAAATVLAREIGMKWLRGGRTGLLALPSSLEPGKYYVALNWTHPSAGTLFPV